MAIASELAALEVPTVISGFSLDEDAVHAPDESFSLRSLAFAQAAARELYAAFATLPRRH